MNYFESIYTVNEKSMRVNISTPYPITAEKIVVNHYYLKSKEEFVKKINKGSATRVHHKKKLKWFDLCDRNEEFDDGILKYREAREKIYRQPEKSCDERLLNALMKNLSPTLLLNTPPQFYAGKLETFLTCRAAAEYLKTKLNDDTPAKSFEETSLKAILKSLSGMSLADARLLIRELPNLLRLPYPAVKDLRKASLQIIPQMMNIMHVNNLWKDYVELDYIQEFLKE